MKIKQFLLCCTFVSCSYQAEELKKENVKLQAMVDSLSSIVSENEKKSSGLVIDENLAIKAFKQHVEFYCSQCEYKDFRVKRVSDMDFDIVLQKRSPVSYQKKWSGQIVRISFTDDGKFIVDNVTGGDYCLGCNM